ncbi:PP2C family protein-serine/threonine phosphatase [Paenibacillus arenosi]|uniref:Serine/threonine protein phosphatase n=1 Tax=Paenibacillus arenosi TaxID=2774142 RepID=A0ABR9AXE5_9BACL|nr:serine/threonine protein phosphatase [Paenibacillus arenosi]MBD8498805.1 serine/threonine protein phosphatase [Paenibacillus arenosi]
MRRDNSEFVTSFVSEAGTFVNNKDFFAFVEMDDKACWVIADGLDTDREIESAELAIQTILNQFQQKPTMSRFRLKRYLRRAHERLKMDSTRVRLKASLTIVATDYTRIRWAGVGNTRLYHFRQGRLTFKSKDLSLAQQLANEEKISDEALDHHEERHNLLQYVGQPEPMEPYVSPKFRLEDGDAMLLCTSGLWEGVSRVEMLDAAEEAQSPEQMVDTLEDILLSKQTKVIRNYTAAAIFANKIFKEDPQKKWLIMRRILIMVLLFALLGGGAWYMMARQAANKAELVQGMIDNRQNGEVYLRDGNYDQAFKEFSDGRNAAIRLKDRVNKQLFTNKQRLVQLVVDGDKLFKEGNYPKALSMYEIALKESESHKEISRADMEERIERTKAHVKVLDMVKEGDMKFQSGNYLGAQNAYIRASKAAATSSYEKADVIQEKLLATQEKLYGIVKGTKQLEAEKLEKDGDKLMTAQDYLMAIESYVSAQQIYQEINMLEKVLGMERKISKALDKMEPPVPPATAPGAADAGASGDAVTPPVVTQPNTNVPASNVNPPASSSQLTTPSVNGTSVPVDDNGAASGTRNTPETSREEAKENGGAIAGQRSRSDGPRNSESPASNSKSTGESEPTGSSTGSQSTGDQAATSDNRMERAQQGGRER